MLKVRHELLSRVPDPLLSRYKYKGFFIPHNVYPRLLLPAWTSHFPFTMFFPSSLFTSFLVFYLSSTRTSASPSSTALAESQAALTTLQTWYNTTSGLWNTCGWWNGANAMTVLADLASIDSSTLPTALYVFNNTYNVAPSVNPAPGVEKVNKNGMPITTYPPGWPFFHPKEGVNASQWLDGYYDDDSWWALAWIAAYDVSKNEEYLGLAIGIFEDLVRKIART
jgi:hypothetical protein